MNDLLQAAVDAHGGLERWKTVRSIRVEAGITGAIWTLKGQQDYLKDVVMTVDTTRERMVTEILGRDHRLRFSPPRIVRERMDGTVIAQRNDPEAAFAGQLRETLWDPLHVAYFQGEALWTYLNTPFLYTQDGFETEEIESIRVDDEIWRRLRVTFPPWIKSHSRQQISCFGPNGLLRRHDYTVDILGGATGLNYASHYREVDGIVFPTRRRIYAYEGDFQPVAEPLLVAIDIRGITLERAGGQPDATPIGALSRTTG